MSVKPIAESLLFVQIGDSKKEYDIVYQMLLMAIVKSYDDECFSLANVIMLIVGMRVDGVVDELISELRAENIINGIDESEVLTRTKLLSVKPM